MYCKIKLYNKWPYLGSGVVDFVQAVSQFACCISEFFSLLVKQTNRSKDKVQCQQKGKAKKKEREEGRKMKETENNCSEKKYHCAQSQRDF